MDQKYGKFDIWKGNIPAKCSWFYRGMVHNALIIRSFLWMNSFNPNMTSFLNDPWYFEIPIAYKPTFLNMDIDYSIFQISELLVNIHWDIDQMHFIFGLHINDNVLGQSSISYNQSNHWVWFPNSKGTKLSAKIYSFFNHRRFFGNHWNGWGKIWKLKVAPRVKHFIWLLMHNAVKTSDYLYSLKLGPLNMCPFCKLFPETAEHLFLNCSKTQLIYNNTCYIIRKPINLGQGLSSGIWLDHEVSGNDNYIQSVIAANVWFIWKARCNNIFKSEEVDYHTVSLRATRHVREYLCASNFCLKNNFIMNNYTFADSPILMIAYAYNEEFSLVGLGFIVANFDAKIMYSGYCGCPAFSDQDAAVKVSSFALQVALQRGQNFKVMTVISSSAEIVKACRHEESFAD